VQRIPLLGLGMRYQTHDTRMLNPHHAWLTVELKK
jgi:hypothetical protein